MTEQRLAELFQDYARYHRHPKNKLCHYIGIPLIVFSVIGLLAKVPFLGIDLAILVGLPVFLYHASLSPKLAAISGLFLVGCYPLAPMFSDGTLLTGFVVGWVFQFVGHFGYEKKSPAVFANIRQLLIGPLWVAKDLLARLRGSDTAPRRA